MRPSNKPVTLHAFLRRQHGDLAHPIDALQQQGPNKQSGMGRAQAQVRTEAEGHVRVGLSVEPHLGGVLEDGLILIGGTPWSLAWSAARRITLTSCAPGR